MSCDPLLLDSITDVSEMAQRQVVVSGSHGGLYPAAVAVQAGVRAVVFNDAGQGFEDAGVAGVLALAGVGMAAAGVDCHSCRIGSAHDMIERGRISVANDTARGLGVTVGQSVLDACSLLEKAGLPTGTLPKPHEARSMVSLPGGREVLLVDSASLVGPGDAGRIIVTGSHGGLIGGDPARALKALARIGVFNDAGIGADEIGISRLPALQARGVAAVTVSHDTCRIGDAASALQTGVISALNALARDLGARAGQPLGAWLRDLTGS